MADISKTINVGITVTLEQAKSAMAEMATQAKQTTDQMTKMGTETQKTGDTVTKSMTTAKDSSHGFFSDMQKDITSSLAAYDLFKKGLQVVSSFLEESVGQALDASKSQSLLKTNIENAGLSYEKLGPQIEAATQANLKLGFTDDQTRDSLGKLTLITKDYSTAVDLNRLAMDLSASKGVDLATATTTVAQIMGGAGAKALVQYGIYMKDGATTAEILNQLQESVAGSAENLAGTPAGAVNEFNAQWKNLQEQVGEKLMPVLLKVVDFANDEIPNIANDFKIVTTAIEALTAATATYLITVNATSIAFAAMIAWDTIYDVAIASAALATGDATLAMAALNATMLLNPAVLLATGIGLTVVAINDLINSSHIADKATTELNATNQKLVDAYNAVHKGAEIKISDLEGETIDMKILNEAAKDYSDANSDQTKTFQAMTDAYNKLHPSAQINIKDLENAKDGSKLLTTAAADYNKVSNDTIVVTNRAATAIAAQKKITDEEAATQKKASDQHIADMKTLSQAFVDVTTKQDQFTFKSADDFGKFSTLLKNTTMDQKDWISEAKQGFTAYEAEVKSIESEITSLDDKIKTATKTMTDFANSTGQNAGDSFAQIVHDAKNSIPDLQKQLQDAQSSNTDGSNNSQIADLQKKLNDANAILTESTKPQYQVQPDLSDAQKATKTQDEINAYDAQNEAAKEYTKQLATLYKQDSENALQISFETLTQKIADKQAETDNVIKQYTIQKNADQQLVDDFNTNEKLMTDQFGESVKARGAIANIEIAANDAITASVQRTTQAMIQANAIRTGLVTFPNALPAKASGGPVSGGQSYLVGEKGPELFTPNMGGSITPNDKVGMGGGVTININNPTVRSDSDLKAIVSMVQDALSRTEELSKIGAYK
jgi:myosin heavy subunit